MPVSPLPSPTLPYVLSLRQTAVGAARRLLMEAGTAVSTARVALAGLPEAVGDGASAAEPAYRLFAASEPPPLGRYAAKPAAAFVGGAAAAARTVGLAKRAPKPVVGLVRRQTGADTAQHAQPP